MRHALYAGLGFTLVALIPVGFLLAVSRENGDSILHYLAPAALVSAFALGTLFWWLLVSRAPKVTLLRATMAGFLTGSVSHVTTWYIAIVALWLTGAKSSLGEKTMGPIDGLVGSLAFAAMSLLVIGWVTAPLAAVAGMVFAKIPAFAPKPAPAR